MRSLLSDREGSLWIGTYSGGLSRLRDGKFTTFSSREGLAHDFARAVFEDRKGNLWVGTTGGGFCRMKGDVFRCFGPADGFVGDREGHASDVRAFYEDDEGRPLDRHRGGPASSATPSGGSAATRRARGSPTAT